MQRKDYRACHLVSILASVTWPFSAHWDGNPSPWGSSIDFKTGERPPIKGPIEQDCASSCQQTGSTVHFYSKPHFLNCLSLGPFECRKQINHSWRQAISVFSAKLGPQSKPWAFRETVEKQTMRTESGGPETKRTFDIQQKLDIRAYAGWSNMKGQKNEQKMGEEVRSLHKTRTGFSF